jgi:tRNA(Arg) A34 adenosine deaminase TadA
MDKDQKEISSGDTEFMKRAIALSKQAVEHGNEPFGAVLVRDGKIVWENENQIHTAHDPSFHAEMGLLRTFCQQTGVTDLSDYTLYSSCEPCFMCSGAMVWTRLGRLVYAASNQDLERTMGKEGCACARMVFSHSAHQPEVTAGVCRQEAIAVLQAYFGNSDGK